MGPKTVQTVAEVQTANCYGCTACEAVCPVKAIAMRTNQRGFLTAQVDSKACVGCGKCYDVCPAVAKIAPKIPRAVYAAKTLDAEVRFHSSSGGVFSELAKVAFSRGGVVYGAGWDKSAWRVVHMRAENFVELETLRGSKYVQSDTRGVYAKVKQDLSRGRLVLFSGTPCQIAGLRRMLGADSELLVTVAIICHSVTSPELLEWYLFEQKKDAKLVSVCFRDKRDGKDGHMMTIETTIKKNNYCGPLSRNPYYRAYDGRIAVRESCLHCGFKCPNVVSDLVIGDFWGVDNFHSGFNDGKGVSAVIVYTDKGCNFWDSSEVESVRSTYENVLAGNPYLERSVMPNATGARRFLKVYRKVGFDKAVTYAIEGGFVYRTLKKVARRVRRMAKSFMRGV